MTVARNKIKVTSQVQENEKKFREIVDLLTINEIKDAVVKYNSMTTFQQREYHRYLSELGYNPWKHWLALPFTKGKKLFNLN